MLRKTKKLLIPFLMIGICSFSDLKAESICDYLPEQDLDKAFEVPEHQTLSYKAKQITKKNKSNKSKKSNDNKNVEENKKIDINSLAIEGVSTCYNAYKSNFDNAINQERCKLAGMGTGSGALNSSYATNLPIIYAKSFSEAIINQMQALAQHLSPNERQNFWNITGLKVKQNLEEFCRGHGCNSTVDLNQHIDNQINMKKAFG